MSTGTKRGFTITELLVVISIIGVLVSLSLPALNMAFMAADKMTCQNKQKELGKACVAYDADKGKLPQIRTGPPSRLPWIALILPQIGEAELYKRVAQGGGMPQQKIPLLVCPSSINAVGNTPVSYVGNGGRLRRDKGDEQAVSSMGDGMGLNSEGKPFNYEVSLAYVTRNDGVSNTMLLTENENARTFEQPGYEGTMGACWSVDFEMQPINEDMEAKLTDGHARPSSRHAGGVVMTFCDTNIKFVSELINQDVYNRILTSHGASNNINQNKPGATEEELNP